MSKMNKFIKGILIIIAITGGTSACASENSSRTVLENSVEQKAEKPDIAVSIPSAVEPDDLLLPEPQLSSEQKEKFAFLLYGLRTTVCQGSFENFLTDKPILNDAIEENELEIQARFLTGISAGWPMDDITEILDSVVYSIDTEPNSMTLTIEQANQLIRMAGGIPNPKLQSYLENEYYSVAVNEDLFTFYFYMEDLLWLQDKQVIEEVSALKDGRIKVTGQSKVGWETIRETPYFSLYDGMILDFEAVLTPNPESVFGGYSVEHFWQSTVNPEGAKKIGKEAILPSYKQPGALSEYAFDYIFKLDGALYQLPFPVSEFVANGWQIGGDGMLEPGQRANIQVIKYGMKLSVAIWNYGQETADYKDCTVVWLRTKSDQTWADVTFTVDGVNNGSTVQSLPLKSYYQYDPLYNNNYGFSIQIENGRAIGFEMGYAPNSEDRKERVTLLTDWEEDPIYNGADSNRIDMVLNQIYYVDIDQDGKKEAIDLTYLDHTIWGKERLCALIDGEATIEIDDSNFDIKTIKLSIEEQGVYLYIIGDNYEGWESSKTILLQKKQSEEIQKTGWKQIGDEEYYLEMENGIGRMAVGWREINEDVWYFADNGKMLSGLQEIDGQLYYFYPTGYLERDRNVEDLLTGKRYWANSDGMCTEIYQIEIGGQLVWSDIARLNLSGCGISDLTPLEGLTNVNVLILDDNQISDLTPLSSLTKLTCLTLKNNQINDLAPLQGLVNLEELRFQGNQISDITPLHTLVKLRILRFDGDQISDITPLQTLVNLEDLSFSGINIRDISPLVSMKKLKNLECIRNQISDVTPLQNLENLKELSLWGSPISDLTPLETLTQIEFIHLESILVTQQQVDELQMALPNCKVYFPKNQRIWENIFE